MPAQRATDPAAPVTRFRSERICAINHEYFFDTREGQLMGPYRTRQEAQQAVQEYIRQCQAQQPSL
ncbi:DUF6316 family protein [Azotobacter salinestris]|uniref:DUF6316 family protein n=1 Tax=Azotobacter salinestris TaxID=69964 RepID=UPI0032DEDC45